MELYCYNLTPNKDIRMGLPEYQNSINHLNDGANQIPRIQSESKWFSIIFKRCKCPENGQKVADIYEHVLLKRCVTWRNNDFTGLECSIISNNSFRRSVDVW